MDFFENAYLGRPTWDIGRPQAAVMLLAESGLLHGEILDAGCGTGENTLFLASRGFRVTGIDSAPGAIEQARAKAADRGLGVERGRGPDRGPGTDRGFAEFVVADALDMASLGRAFDCAIDVGLFHCLRPEDRARYADALASVIRPGGRAFVLAWSDRNQFGRGPERIRGRDLREAFASGWTIDSIVAAGLETNLPEGRVHAWLAALARRP